MKVLVIEDSEDLQDALREGLTRSGFFVDVVGDGRQGLSYALAAEYDVIVLDLMLPGLDGLQVLGQYRKHRGFARILILSARDQVEVRVKGLELGADDYLTKPFVFSELLARVRALVRRRHDLSASTVELDQLTVDIERRQVTISGEIVALTKNEYNLLECLALRRGRVVTKEQLLNWIYATDAPPSEKIVEVWMSTLRKKLREAGADLAIETRRGFGYIIE